MSQVSSAPRIVRFALVGCANTAVDFAVFSILVFVGNCNPVVANTISYAGGVACSYTLNRAWTFADRAGVRKAGELVGFVLINTLLVVLSNVLIAAMATGLPLMAAKVVATGITFGVGYWAARNIVFAGGAPYTGVR
jgi:putative flippase GtrA